MTTATTTRPAAPLTLADVLLTVTAEPEQDSAYDSLGGCMRKKQIAKLVERAESNEWEWCSVEVRAEYQAEDGTEYDASAYLGGCSYKSRLDFVKNSGYYEDMVAEALADLNTQLGF